MSGDKNGIAYQVDIKTHETKQICEAKAQILDLLVEENEVWVATTDSDLNSYDRGCVSRSIRGKSSLTAYEITDSKKYIITKDSDNRVQVRNLVEGSVLEFEGTIGDAVKQFNVGKSCNSWFSTNLQLGCLMLDFTQNDIAAAGEIVEDQILNYGEIFLRKLFYYLIASEEGKLIEKDGVASKRFLLPEGCDFEEAAIVLKQALGAGIMQPLLFTQPTKLPHELNLQLPLWIQKIIYKTKQNRI